jgi:cytochrome c553
MNRTIGRLCSLAVLLAAAPCAALAQVEAPPPEIAEKLQLCAGCHGGDDGMPVVEKAPILHGQQLFYMLVQLRDYRAERRSNEIMTPIAKELSDDEMKALVTYFSKLEWPAYREPAEDADVTKAKSLAVEGQCTQCHLGAYVGDSRVPRISHQKIDYLDQTMRDFRDDVRKNAPAMASIVKDWSDEDIAAMSKYLAGL